MLNPKGNVLPRCLHPVDHYWLLLQYDVVVQLGLKVVALHQCTKCLRIKVEELTEEKET